MVEGYFPVHVEGPLREFALGFQRELAGLGYTPFSARGQLALVARLSEWMTGQGMAVSQLTDTAVAEFIAVRRAGGYRYGRSVKVLAPLLAFLRGQGVVAWPEAAPLTAVAALVERFREYLLGERGLTAAVVAGYTAVARDFLAGFEAGGIVELNGMQARDVCDFMLVLSGRLAAKTVQGRASALRSLLKFLHVTGLIRQPLAQAVPAVALRRLADIPRFLEPEQVRILLDGCDRDTAEGRRAFAVILLMLRMGLRCGEVARLQLEDIDWRRGEVLLRGKRGRVDRLPLPADVAEAVADYLRTTRAVPGLDRCVFLRIKAPHRGLTPTGVTQLVGDLSARIGLGLVHAHRLRHTAATGMLRAGAPLAEVGQVLRHRRAATTAIYAKVDIDALRTLARPWPEAR